MSLNRLVLRTAGVTALNNFGVGPFPTLAGPHIYDSKIEPVDSVDKDVAYPMCVIYTDYDRNAVAHRELTEPRSLTITFELLIGILSRDDQTPNYTLNMPVTDSELEASLDIFEFQIFEALRADNAAANVFRTICYGPKQITSRRGATTEGGTKIAARQVTYEADCLPEPSAPTVPSWMAPFLDQLEASDGFDGIGEQLQALYAGGAAVTEMDRIARTLGWSRDTYERLGYPPKPLVMLGTPVTWLNQHGQPL
ncbi:MAG: hypothetical protein J0I99_00725 [Devosia sp.]|uniref:hypothetical protein n=1 Tax=Devosia sp. TaxID=1871048 RepID=UPI001ACDE5EB|nr:hypothetical protein [Devosia sp.]MBN9308725.1 hypothetical protein [Devosia sp.]MBN9314241.1 hypothetical protein [Devosia sp.]